MTLLKNSKLANCRPSNQVYIFRSGKSIIKNDLGIFYKSPSESNNTISGKPYSSYIFFFHGP